MKKFLFFILILLFLPLLSSANFNHLIITEIQIEGNHSSEDYIKIYNPTSNQIDASGFKLRKRSSTGKEYSIRVFPKDSIIAPFSFFVWANSKGNFADRIKANVRSSATISKNNSIALLNKKGEVLDALCWGNSKNPLKETKCFPQNPGKNQQLKRKINNGEYQDGNNNENDFYLSRGEEKEKRKKEPSGETITTNTSSHPPVAIAGPDIIVKAGQEITFDGSKSYDPDQDHLFFNWNFGDGETSKERKIRHTFCFPGKYNVALEVSDGKNKSTDQIIANIIPGNVFINEISFKEGWIEIANQNNYPVSLSGWEIQSRKHSFVFPNNSYILPKQFIVLRKEILNIPLDSSSSIILSTPPNVVLEKDVFSVSGNSKVLAKTSSGDFTETNIPTPGAPNILSGKELIFSRILESNEEFSNNKKTINLVQAEEGKILRKSSNSTATITPQNLNNIYASSLTPFLKEEAVLIVGVIISIFFVFMLFLIKRLIVK